MSLTVATLIPGLILALLGAALLARTSAIVSALRGMPRSMAAAVVLFGAGSAGFLYQVWYLSPADFGEYRTLLFIGFAVLAVLAFVCAPDFLAVRGLSVSILVGAWPILYASYMVFGHWQVYFYKVPVFIAIVFAIWLGAYPYHLRDFFEWLFRPGPRARALGGVLFAYGLLLSVLAFTY